jgi:hypothetical protein
MSNGRSLLYGEAAGMSTQLGTDPVSPAIRADIDASGWDFSYHVGSGEFTREILTNYVKPRAPVGEKQTAPPQVPARTPSELEEVFESLVSEWKQSRRLSSSVADRITHSAYLRIIGLGPAVLPLLLKELQREPDHWLVALYAVAGGDMAAGADSFEAAVSRWLQWGRERGYVG